MRSDGLFTPWHTDVLDALDQLRVEVVW